MPKKQCTKCGEWKDLEGFYKDKFSKSGIDSACKKCVSLRNKLKKRRDIKTLSDNYIKAILTDRSQMIRSQITQEMIQEKRREIKEQRLLKDNGKRKCRECGQIKELGDFYNKKICRDCRENIKILREIKREAKRKAKRKSPQELYEENEKKKQKSREYYKNIGKTKMIKGLNDHYVKMKIVQRINLEYKDITPEMIQLKREQLLFYRQFQQLKRRINDGIIN